MTGTVVEAGRAKGFWPGGLGYAAVPLLLGQIPGIAAFTLNANAAVDIGLTEVPVPAWVFAVVWTIIYPCMGLAAWQLRRDVPGPAAAVPLAVLVAGFLQTMLFWLSDSLRAVAVADATGVLLAGTTVWVFSRYSRAATAWLLPWLLWMPVTLAIKIAVLV
ncbi:MAG TPA: TspO/MBR family protein [Actinophytocola sp.]|uniref:TspO/MBR family protein n=1 Tax=Actinophytocola sp. TaxID=1872138 RepID=UPI002DDCFADE|nr:TspO/MBR family protein [Actinophytocola sp.]HEV2781561.1 TspO/MBR family protein [Actinophytocola sp.]